MTFRGGNGIDVPLIDVAATIPGLGVITSPVPATKGGAVLVDTSQDLSVTWVPIPIGQIRFKLVGGGTSAVGASTVSIGCTFDGASGSGLVPRALLSSLKAMSGTSPVHGGLRSELDATTVIDGLTVETQSFQSSPTSGTELVVTLM
jgi:hypothetical protein